MNSSDSVTLAADTNQAQGIARFAIAFLDGASPGEAALERVALFHADAVLCGLSALKLGCSAPQILRSEALEYPDPRGAQPFGSDLRCKPEKVVAANCSAVREWDANGTNFGYNPLRGHTAGEFGHNDFYPVVVAAAQEMNLDGALLLRSMLLVDEIRGRLAEVFSLKTYKIDHVLHGAIASAAVYGALKGASANQIESAIGMVVAHYVPWRAIRAGRQLSDSKGASAALSAEVAVLSVNRALRGWVGPGDIFRNPESLFRQFEPTQGDSPFELTLTRSGDDFAVMGMHFKIGLYEHQSAGGIDAVLSLLREQPHLMDLSKIASVVVRAYEPAFGIIGDHAKRRPTTRQSADHSMVYILATVLRKAAEAGVATWDSTMILPEDYSDKALANPLTLSLIDRIQFEHGGPAYDDLYPDGIPTSVHITDSDGRSFESGLVMYPPGHARRAAPDSTRLLAIKMERLETLAFGGPANGASVLDRLLDLARLPSEEVATLYRFSALNI